MHNARSSVIQETMRGIRLVCWGHGGRDTAGFDAAPDGSDYCGRRCPSETAGQQRGRKEPGSPGARCEMPSHPAVCWRPALILTPRCPLLLGGHPAILTSQLHLNLTVSTRGGCLRDPAGAVPARGRRGASRPQPSHRDGYVNASSMSCDNATLL